MASIPRQDLPPQGGFASYSYHRYIPKKGFTGLTALGLVSFSVIGGFARWVHCQRIENEKRIARQQERGEFLKKLDVHLHKKFLAHVQRQAELDVLAMDKMLKAEAKH